MKYILLTLLAMALCFLGGRVILSFYEVYRRQHGKPPMESRRFTLLSLLCGLLLAAAVSLAYLLPYAPAEDSAQAYLAGSGTVRVEKADHGYYFDGPGEQTAVFFVPGAKVDAAAYAPLLSRIAAGGADCYLYEPPFHMAFSVTTGAEEALADYPHETWYTAGHSLGGVTASSYAIKNPAAFDGIILLASYPAEQVPDSLSVCSIYGDRDTKLDRKAYESHRTNFPADTEEVVIEGANHAQFGDYGDQKGDSEATISPAEQQAQTAEIILAFINGEQ
jgi:hypothetical protein